MTSEELIEAILSYCQTFEDEFIKEEKKGGRERIEECFDKLSIKEPEKDELRISGECVSFCLGGLRFPARLRPCLPTCFLRGFCTMVTNLANYPGRPPRCLQCRIVPGKSGALTTPRPHIPRAGPVRVVGFS